MIDDLGTVIAMCTLSAFVGFFIAGIPENAVKIQGLKDKIQTVEYKNNIYKLIPMEEK